MKHSLQPILPRLKGPTCPHTAMAKYLNHRMPHYPQTEPLFCLATGKRLTQLHFRYLLRRQLQRAGLNPQSFNTHSFRIGAATSAAQAGVPAQVIKCLGRWRSHAYKGYIRPTFSMVRKAASTITRRSRSIPHKHWHLPRMFTWLLSITLFWLLFNAQTVVTSIWFCHMFFHSTWSPLLLFVYVCRFLSGFFPLPVLVGFSPWDHSRPLYP